MRRLLQQLPPGIAETVQVARLTKFALVGMLASLVYYLLLWCMVEVLGISVLVSTSIAFVLVAIENYFLHRNWTFRSANAHTTAFPRFLAMNIGGFSINWLVMFGGAQVLTFNYLLVQAVAIVVVVAWNYVLSHFWIFAE